MPDPIPEHPWWLNAYSTVQPTGWALRHAFPNRWLRIHSLTNSKRYPETDFDWAELRERHFHSSSLLLDGVDAGFLIVPWACASDDVFRGLGLTPTRGLPEYQPDDDEPPTGPFHAVAFRWSFEAFLPILEAIADDATRALFVSTDALRIYAPYDGGADLFTSDPAHLVSLRDDLSSYMSARPDGL
jgi:hypothetical protein